MNNDALERARAKLALQQLCRTHLYDPNVSLIDIGFKSTAGRVDRSRLAIRVHVARKFSAAQLEWTARGRATAPVPRSVGGFATDVLEGRYRAHRWPAWQRGRWALPDDPRKARLDPLRGGISISRGGRFGAGTLGGVVFDLASGDAMILSNWHVLAAHWAARPGLGIYQPAGMDGGTTADLVARYARDAMAAHLDAAVALVDDSRLVSTLQQDVGPVRGRAQPWRGMRVVKSGRTSGVTHGEITGTDGVMAMRYGHVKWQIREVVSIEPVNGKVISEGGDSGSLYLDEPTGAGVALHFAGSNYPERALAIDVNPVVQTLAVEFAGG